MKKVVNRMETFEEQKKELGYWTLFWDLISRDEVKQKDLEGLPEEYKKQVLVYISF